ncbi:MAG TPA: NnrU family protein [Paracoccaceae bacterium]|nr:NnrU family protein [Paracoccaceae bacterium]HMO72192.1 NnrU family protein [Paracoccaceae bacterium]
MNGWAPYLAAWAVFLLSHAIPVRPWIKGWLVARLGAGGFGLAYSAVSVAALAWLIVAAGRAPWVPLWDAAAWQRAFAQGATLAACLLIAFAAFAPNPLSFAGWRNARFEPDRPGIVGLLRHPFLAALVLWAAGHVPANGDLAHALMFGGFAAFAALGMAMIDRRRRRELGTADWARLTSGRITLPPAWPVRLAAGLGLWWVLAALHPILIGPAVWP